VVIFTYVQQIMADVRKRKHSLTIVRLSFIRSSYLENRKT